MKTIHPAIAEHVMDCTGESQASERSRSKPLPPAEYLREVFEDAGSTVRWRVRSGSATIGKLVTGVTNGYHTVSIAGRKMLVHRILYKMRTGIEPDCIDHIDGNRKNNSQENLRPASIAQNGQNRPKQRNSTSGFKGVHKSPRSNNWVVRVVVGKKCHRGGVFSDINEASRAAQALRRRLHTEFAHD